MPPAARLTDMHACPMVTPGIPPIPHVGGPISGPCAPTVLIGSLPAARIGDMAVCVGPPDSIVMGSATVLIAGMPAARVGDMCTCVGPPDTIAMGSTKVMIGKKPAARVGDSTVHGGSITGPGAPTVMIN